MMLFDTVSVKRSLSIVVFHMVNSTVVCPLSFIREHFFSFKLKRVLRALECICSYISLFESDASLFRAASVIESGAFLNGVLERCDVC